MKKYLVGVIGLALFGASSLIGQTIAFGGETGCCAEAGCGEGCNAGCGGCNDGCQYCPRCGCRLEPVCHPTCETKKETVHKYSCVCKTICIPGVTRIGERNECSENGGACAAGCTACEACNAGCDPGCQQGCDCHCMVRTVHKLVVIPVTKEHSVRACTVEWVCPKCGACCGGCEAGPASNAAPQAAPGPTAAPPAPAPGANRLPPPPKTTSVVPLPENIRMAGAGF